jgi:hypothetical protein
MERRQIVCKAGKPMTFYGGFFWVNQQRRANLYNDTSKGGKIWRFWYHGLVNKCYLLI